MRERDPRREPAGRDGSRQNASGSAAPRRDPTGRESSGRDSSKRDSARQASSGQGGSTRLGSTSRDGSRRDSTGRDGSRREQPSRGAPVRDTPSRDTPSRDTPGRGTSGPGGLSGSASRLTSRRLDGPAIVGKFGALPGVTGILIVAASALLGVIFTVIMRRDPGTVLGLLIVAGTVVACLAVRARSVRLLIPAPTISYVPAAIIAGAINDRNTDTSHTADLLNAGSWIANGFLMMALATVVALVFTGLRLYLLWHYRPQPRRFPRAADEDRTAASRSGADTGLCGNCGTPLELDMNGRCRRCHAPRGVRPPGIDSASRDRSRPPGQPGPARSQPGGAPAQDSGPARAENSGPYRSENSGPYRSENSGPYRSENSAPYRSPNGRRPQRPQQGIPSRPAIAGPHRASDSTPYRPLDSGSYPEQASGPYPARDPYGSDAYPEPADLTLRASPAGRRKAAGA